VLVIPLVMIQVMDILLFVHRLGVVFLFFALGVALGITVVLAAHVFFLVFSFIVFARKYGTQGGV